MGNPFSDQIGSCCGCGCTWTPTVKGCNSLALQGATVSVSGGPSGTTNSSGQVTLSGVVPGSSVTVSKSRFVSQTVTVPANCGGMTITLLPDTSAYVCTTVCADPAAQTLHLTDSLTGASVTLTWNGTNWTGNYVYASGCCVCPPGGANGPYGVTIIYTLSTSLVLVLSWGTQPPPGCSNDGTLTPPQSSRTCPPTLNVQYTLDPTTMGSSNLSIYTNVYCLCSTPYPTDTFTVTE